jgi:hypothetical protein
MRKTVRRESNETISEPGRHDAVPGRLYQQQQPAGAFQDDGGGTFQLNHDSGVR